MWVELLQVEQRVRFDRLEQLAEARAIVARNRKAHKKRQRELARLALARQRKDREARGLRVEPGGAPRGSVSCLARWVRLLAAMEPGRWYGWGAMIDRGHKPKWSRFKLFLDQAVNPKRPEKQFNGRYWEQGRAPRPEPTYLWRLNKWGLALQDAVLREPRALRVNVLELEGAKPELW